MNVTSGAVEQIVLPPPMAEVPYQFFTEGMVSARNGDLIGTARTSGSVWAETFLLGGASGVVTLFRDPAGEMNDSRHSWAPDGEVFALLRRPALAGPAVLAVVDPTTGAIDTVMPAPQPGGISTFFWVGNDTIVYFASANGSEFPYRSISRTTGHSAVWSVVPFGDFVTPVVSPDRRWIANWRAEDSTVANEGAVRFTRLRLYDRETGEQRVLRQGRTGTTGHLTRAFDPTSRYLAFCRDSQDLVIYSLVEHREIKVLRLPYCWSLSWSWGSEGPPAGQ
jgi:hypothetical protein